MTSLPPVPPEAITAAYAATEGIGDPIPPALMKRILDAAAPHLAVAEGERLRGAYVCRRHGWEHCEDITCQMLADAVAAEREACAQLAEQVEAQYLIDRGDHADFAPFASLLRETRP